MGEAGTNGDGQNEEEKKSKKSLKLLHLLYSKPINGSPPFSQWSDLSRAIKFVYLRKITF